MTKSEWKTKEESLLKAIEARVARKEPVESLVNKMWAMAGKDKDDYIGQAIIYLPLLEVPHVAAFRP